MLSPSAESCNGKACADGRDALRRAAYRWNPPDIASAVK
jgi:hypothetical protein